MQLTNERICFLLRCQREDSDWVRKLGANYIEEQEATIARLQDLVAKFQRGGTSTLYAEGHMD